MGIGTGPAPKRRMRPLYAPGRSVALADSSVRVTSMPVRCLLEMEDGSYVECAVMQMNCESSPQSVTMPMGADGQLYASPFMQPPMKISVDLIVIRKVAADGVSIIERDDELIDKTVEEAKKAEDESMRRFSELEADK